MRVLLCMCCLLGVQGCIEVLTRGLTATEWCSVERVGLMTRRSVDRKSCSALCFSCRVQKGISGVVLCGEALKIYRQGGGDYVHVPLGVMALPALYSDGEVLLSSAGYGATKARLTPGQKVRSFNASAQFLCVGGGAPAPY